MIKFNFLQKVISRNKAFRFISMLGISTVLLLPNGCSMFGGFSRSNAVTIISGEGKYKKAIKEEMSPKWLTGGYPSAWQLSKSDPPPQAAVRIRENYKVAHPELFIAEHLGLLKITFEAPQLGASEISMPSELYAQDLGVWHSKAATELTDEGRKLWSDLGKKVDEQSLPLAVRGTPEITGMRDDGENEQRAEFTYGWDATSFGAALDPNNDAFKKLPKDLQDAMGKRMKNFTGKERGIARFKQYDDGWRIIDIYLDGNFF